MQRRTATYNALMSSLILHTALIIWSSFYFADNAEEIEDFLPVVLLSANRLPEPKIRKPYLVPQIEPPALRARSTVARAGRAPKDATEFDKLTPAAAIHKNRVTSPKAPIESDAVPDFVTQADIPLIPDLAVPDTSLGKESHATSPSPFGVRRGRGAAGKGVGKIQHRGDDSSKNSRSD